MKQKPSRKILLSAFVFVAAGLLALSPLLNVRKTSAETLEELRSRSSELSKQIAANHDKAKELADQADTLKRKLDEINLQISQMSAQIELTEVKINELQLKLDQTQAELDNQKDLLRASMRALYKRGGASTIELLASADNFSEFVNGQEYIDRVKQGIQKSTEKIIELKQQIQVQKKDQEDLKVQQEAQRTVLQSSQNEQTNILLQTQGEEARYQQMVNDLRAQQLEITRKIAARVGVVYGGAGGYPAVWANAPQDSMIDDWGMFNRECVSFTAWKVHSDYLFGKKNHDMPFWGGVGNANQWPDNARAGGISVDRNPKVGDIAISYIGFYGHAMYVEEVLSNRQVHVSQYNFGIAGTYSEMTISADNDPSLGQLQFIHFP